MINLSDLLPLLFGLAVICVGALALGFIADGLGKFRAPIRKTEESYDERWKKYNKQYQVKPHLHVVPDPIPQGEIYQIGDRHIVVKPDPSSEQLERLRKAFERRTKLYNHETDEYL